MTKVVLQTPIKTGTLNITEVDLRRPVTGELRGVRLFNLLQMDVTAISTILPRITTPALLPDDVAGLDPADFMALATEVVGFFMTPAARAEAMASL
jgi:hypothetical protein